MKEIKFNTRDLSIMLIEELNIHSPLKLQKLLFFFYLENLKKSILIKDLKFEAWVYGPVNPQIYQEFKPYFDKTDELENFMIKQEQTNSKEIKLMIEDFINNDKRYQEKSVTELVDLSHENNGWIKARQRAGLILEPEEPSNEIILDKEIVL